MVILAAFRDTTGNQNYHDLIKSCYKDAQIFFIFFSVIDPDSFKSATETVGHIRPDGAQQTLEVPFGSAEEMTEAFEMAREVDPDVELVLNEQISSNQYDDVGGEQFFLFAKQLLDQGVPIDGIGLQGHQLMGVPDRGALHAYLKRIEDLGVFIEITEMDMRIANFAGHDDPLGAQAEAHQMCAEVFASVPAVRGVMFWGAADTDTWLDHFSRFDAGAPNQPLLFDKHLEAKPAYYGFKHGLVTAS